MNSRTRTSFWRAYAALDSSAKEAAQQAYHLFLEDPARASLRFKKPGGCEHIWSVRINEQYRAVGERQGDTVWWAWIGTHNEFDKLFR